MGKNGEKVNESTVEVEKNDAEPEKVKVALAAAEEAYLAAKGGSKACSDFVVTNTKDLKDPTIGDQAAIKTKMQELLAKVQEINKNIEAKIAVARKIGES